MLPRLFDYFMMIVTMITVTNYVCPSSVSTLCRLNILSLMFAPAVNNRWTMPLLYTLITVSGSSKTHAHHEQEQDGSSWGQWLRGHYTSTLSLSAARHPATHQLPVTSVRILCSCSCYECYSCLHAESRLCWASHQLPVTHRPAISPIPQPRQR